MDQTVIALRGSAFFATAFLFFASVFCFSAAKEKTPKRSAKGVCGSGWRRKMWKLGNDGVWGSGRLCVSMCIMADKRVILVRCRVGWTEDEAWE